MLRYLRQKLEAEYHHINLWYFVSFLSGIIFFFQHPYKFSPYISFLVLIPLAGIIFYPCNRNIILQFISISIFAFVTGFCVSGLRINTIKINPIKKNIVTDIIGVVSNIKPALRGMQVTLDGLKSNDHNLSKVRINIANKFVTDINRGDEIKLRVKLFPLTSGVLPGSFDFGFYMYTSGIEATGYALLAPEIINRRKSKIRDFIDNVRLKIYKRLIEVIGEANGNFAAAILIGETKAIPRDIARNMRDTGVAHILSVSGLHLSLVAMIFFTFSRALMNCSNIIAYNCNIKLIAALISIIGSYIYLQISGSNIAATRAFIMTSLFMGAVMIDRSPHPLRSVVIAALAILLFLPEYLLHPSFQLSFTAVLCLISGYEFYMRNNRLFGSGGGVFRSIKLYIFANIYSSFLASIVTAPYVIYHFYKFANYSVLMNLIAVPLMSFFMMPLALLFLFAMPLGIDFLVLKLLSFFITVVIDSAAFIVNLPYAVWYVGHITPTSLVIFTLGFFWVCFWQTGLRFWGLAIIFVSLIMMFYTPKPSFIYDDRFKIIALEDEEKNFKLYSQNKISEFTSEYWTAWYGKQNAEIREIDMVKTDRIFMIGNNKTVSLNYNNCLDANVMIITSKKLQCKNDRQIISHENLKKYKQVSIFCDGKDICNIEYAREKTY